MNFGVGTRVRYLERLLHEAAIGVRGSEDVDINDAWVTYWYSILRVLIGGESAITEEQWKRITKLGFNVAHVSRADGSTFHIPALKPKLK